MPTPNHDERLSRIGTQWTMVIAAHGPAPSQADELRRRLLVRYSGAAYRYVLAAVRDADVAEDLCQDFAVRFLRGDFRSADPQRGRFRDYVKAALVNLVNDHWRSRAQQPNALAADVAAPPDCIDDAKDDCFVSAWRTEILERTWLALREARPNYDAVLRARVENPDLTSKQLAERLSADGPTSYNAALFRKTLERAHAKFADLLVAEVAESLDAADSESLMQELQELDLLKYCRTALERRGDG